MKLIVMVAILAIAMCCVMWDSVVYTADAPDGSQAPGGPHGPGGSGGPACQGGRRRTNATGNSTG